MSDLLFLSISAILPVALLIVLVRMYKKMRLLRIQCNNMLQEKELIFGFVHDVAEVFADADSIELSQMLKRVLFYALRTSRASSGAIYMFDEDDETLYAETVSGIFPPLVQDEELNLDDVTHKAEHINRVVMQRSIARGEGLIGEVADLGAPLLLEDAERDLRVPLYKADFIKIRSLLLLPLRFHQQVLGVLVVMNRVDGRPFGDADLNLLQSLVDQATVSIHFVKLREELNMKQRMDHDLDLARSIQASLLPKELPRISGVELAAFSYPALEIGGDYYDCFQVDEDRIGIAIADVSGKGISGAIMMAVCRSILRSQARGRQSPAEVLREVNHIIKDDVAEDIFVTMLYMVLNTKTHELVVARAGHDRPLLIQGGDSGLTPVDSAGAALGLVDKESFDSLINEVRLTLQSGSVIVAYTDGITEAMNAEQQEWGIENFCKIIKEASSEGAHSVLNRVRQQLLRYVGDTEQSDDITMIALRII